MRNEQAKHGINAFVDQDVWLEEGWSKKDNNSETKVDKAKPRLMCFSALAAIFPSRKLCQAS